MLSWTTHHLKLHFRFYASVMLGIVVWAATVGQAPEIRLLLAGDSFFVAHIVAMGLLAVRADHESFKQRVSQGDEGLFLIAFITLGAVALSVGSIFTLLNQKVETSAFGLALAISSVPLGWFMLHTVSAFHYAHVYFGDRDSAGGIEFPGGGRLRAWDFLYFAFVIGMTAQVSDATVQTTSMRRLVLAHSVVSFFYNTVILALAVNLAVTLAS